MKAIVAIACFLFVSFTHATAQRWTFSAGLGPAIPVGKYGSKSLSDSLSAFAKTGPVLQLTAAYRIGRYWGVSVLTSGGWNRVDTKKMDDELASDDPGSRFNVTSDPWVFVTLMGGPYGEWSLNKRWSVTVQGYAGVWETKRPKYTATAVQSDGSSGQLGSGSTQEDWMLDENTAHTGFAFQVGAGVRYALGRHWFLCGKLEYASAWYKAKGTSSNTGPVNLNGGSVTTGSGAPPIISPTSTPTYVQPISTLQPTVGVGVHI